MITHVFPYMCSTVQHSQSIWSIPAINLLPLPPLLLIFWALKPIFTAIFCASFILFSFLCSFSKNDLRSCCGIELRQQFEHRACTSKESQPGPILFVLMDGEKGGGEEFEGERQQVCSTASEVGGGRGRGRGVQLCFCQVSSGEHLWSETLPFLVSLGTKGDSKEFALLHRRLGARERGQGK